MDGTIDVVSSRCGEWSDLNAVAIDLHIVDGRSPRLFRRFRLAVLPGAIGKDVEKGAIIYQQKFRAFGYGDRR
jgi:hypothetical protein